MGLIVDHHNVLLIALAVKTEHAHFVVRLGLVANDGRIGRVSHMDACKGTVLTEVAANEGDALGMTLAAVSLCRGQIANCLFGKKGKLLVIDLALPADNGGIVVVAIHRGVRVRGIDKNIIIRDLNAVLFGKILGEKLL